MNPKKPPASQGLSGRWRVEPPLALLFTQPRATALGFAPERRQCAPRPRHDPGCWRPLRVWVCGLGTSLRCSPATGRGATRLLPYMAKTSNTPPSYPLRAVLLGADERHTSEAKRVGAGPACDHGSAGVPPAIRGRDDRSHGRIVAGPGLRNVGAAVPAAKAAPPETDSRSGRPLPRKPNEGCKSGFSRNRMLDESPSNSPFPPRGGKGEGSCGSGGSRRE